MMKRKLASIFLAMTIVAMLFASAVAPSSALADSGKHKGWDKYPVVIGQETQVGKYAKVKCIGKNYDKKGKLESIEYEAIISSIPTITDDGQSIDARWYEKKDPAG